jgi:hypothetical protein
MRASLETEEGAKAPCAALSADDDQLTIKLDAFDSTVLHLIYLSLKPARDRSRSCCQAALLRSQATAIVARLTGESPPWRFSLIDPTLWTPLQSPGPLFSLSVTMKP